MNALEFENSPVQRFRPPRKRQKATKVEKDDDSTSVFGVPSSTTARKWVSPQHEDTHCSGHTLKPATRKGRSRQRVLPAQRRGKYNTTKGGVCCGRTSGTLCSQHQDRTIGNSIQHYGLQRRNIRPLAMVGMCKKQNGATNAENCKQWQRPSQHARHGLRDAPSAPPPPSSPLRDVANSIGVSRPGAGSTKCRPTVCDAASLSDGRDKSGLDQQCEAPIEHSNGREAQNESFFSQTEVTLLQLSQLSSQLPRPGASPISPLLSSSPHPKPTSDSPVTQCSMVHDEQTNNCRDDNHHKQAIEAQDVSTSDCTYMLFFDAVTAVTPRTMEASAVRQEQVKVGEDFDRPGRESSVTSGGEPVPAQLPSVSDKSGGDRLKGNCNGHRCDDDPSMTDSLADIMLCVDFDFDLSMSFQAMQISRDSPGKILAPETPLVDGEYITTRRRYTSAPATRDC